jgi:hypothetical protein
MPYLNSLLILVSEIRLHFSSLRTRIKRSPSLSIKSLDPRGNIASPALIAPTNSRIVESRAVLVLTSRS